MSTLRHMLILVCVVMIGACTSAATTTKPPDVPTAIPAAQAIPPTTALEATQPPTAEPIAEAGPREVSFQTEDGVTLSGTLFGVGGVGVVLSHMRPVDQTSWHAFAQTLADNGYLALAYDFRGYGKSEGPQALGLIDRDVRAAVDFLRSQGAGRVVLIGASMGGTASAKVAAVVGDDGLVVLSGPQSFEGLNVASEDLQLGGMPSLWITSRGDPVTPGMQAMHDAASDPKTLHIYDGDAHGTFIFDTADGADLARRILEFVTANIPPDR